MARTKKAGIRATVLVLLAVGGLFVLVGVILMLMWAGGGIQHRPSKHAKLTKSGTAAQLGSGARDGVKGQRWICFTLLLLGLFTCSGSLSAQWKEPPSTGSPVQHLPDRTIFVGQSGLGPVLAADLVNEEANAKRHRAVVEVRTDGVQLVNPAEVGNQPKLDEAHLQYRLDNGPVQDTTSTRKTFENLSVGSHEIHIALAGNDNHQIGKGITVTVNVP